MGIRVTMLLGLIFIGQTVQSKPPGAHTPLRLREAGRTAELTVATHDLLAPQEQLPVSSDPAAVFRSGKEALQAGKLDEAEEDFRRVIALDPKSGAAHVNLGVVSMRQRQWDKALFEFHEAQSLLPREAGIQLNIGLVYYRKGEFAAAVEPISNALQRTPDSRQARYLLGLCYFFINRYKEASDALAPIWDAESTNLNYLYVLSIAAAKSTNSELRVRAYNQMVDVGRNTPEFHLYLGKARLAEGDTSKALDEFQAAAASQPDMPLVHYFLGRTLLERKAYPEAIAELELAVKADSSFSYSYEDLGILYAQLDESGKAKRCFQQAIERNHSLVNSYFGLAKLERDSKRYVEALEMMDHAVELVPQSASLHFTRGQLLKQLGRAEKAREDFDLAAKLHKSFNDRLQQDHSADTAADAEAAAQE